MQVPEYVIQHLIWAIEREECDENNCIKYSDFLNLFNDLQCFEQFYNLLEKDILLFAPDRFAHVEKDELVLSEKEVVEWVKNIYIRRDNMLVLGTDSDLASVVEAWDLDEIVEEVFGTSIESSDNYDTENNTQVAEFKQRKRKRDIVKNAIKNIVRSEADRDNKTTKESLRRKIVKSIRNSITFSTEFE